jgi:hypothetical protein
VIEEFGAPPKTEHAMTNRKVGEGNHDAGHYGDIPFDFFKCEAIDRT